jgi:TonB family protein
VVVAAIVLAMPLARPLGAQASGATVSGIVADSAGLPIGDAEVRALGSGLRARSDEQGQFGLGGVGLGEAMLEARRLGFRPETLRVVVPAGGITARFALRSAPTVLEAVAVTARRRRYTGRLAGYYERLASRTQGTFITRDDIDRGNPRQLTDVLRRAAGVEIVRGSRLRLRGRNCAPLVWIDGVSMPAGEVELNTFAPSSLEGIEIYMTASGAPGRYQATGDEARCGTVLLWSRGGDTEERRAPLASEAVRLEKMLASGEVYTAGDVDVPARLADPSGFSIPYPADLFAAGIGGIVAAEFVVDSAGSVEAGTFNIIGSAHVLFSRAAYDAISTAAFTPGLRARQRVRQLVQMRFRFDPPAGGR